MSATTSEAPAVYEDGELKGRLTVDHTQIYQANTFLYPRTANLILLVHDKEDKPIAEAYVAWSADIGQITDYSFVKTNERGWAAATFVSEKPGVATIKAKVSKPGHKPLELATKVEVLENQVMLEVVNTPAVGEILLNGQSIGQGTIKHAITKTGIYYVSWGEVDGYVAPEPAKLYVNVGYSSAPTRVEGVYRRAGENPDSVKLTVFVCITYDDRTGIPNPLPLAKVELGDGQVGVADISGRAEFNVKASAGPLRIRALHPDTWGVDQEVEVNVGSRDLRVNVDFGPSFGGEESADFSVHEEQETGPPQYEEGPV